ncbi:flavodoxin family protein [Flavobacterium aestivum]|uniref:flavodoxin family protein n=1 Tax=Flavobacterium aestivum TaxID=3003257 RepID=UPI0022859FB2|nr:NAD(P)H-dependent oxidoreductase [Flavobacterium aestivum]
MNLKGVIIQGSSRSNGNTNKIVSFVQKETSFDIIDLKSKQIGGFDYDSKNKDDDFLPLMEEIVNKYDTIIFATPVYWYSMSGIMKNFFDRIADCLKNEKEIGEKLQGKAMGMISCGSDSELKKGFEMPFVETANYLGMYYLGNVHTWVENEIISESLKKDLTIFIEEKINAVNSNAKN